MNDIIERITGYLELREEFSTGTSLAEMLLREAHDLILNQEMQLRTAQEERDLAQSMLIEQTSAQHYDPQHYDPRSSADSGR